LNSPRTGDLTGAYIDGQYFSGWTDLFGEIEGRNAMSGRDIEDSKT
jgi:hypothetical protein